MTDLFAGLAANWLLLAIGLAFLIFLIIGVSWLACWYFWRWVIEMDREPEPLPSYTNIGDVALVIDGVPHVPEKAKRRAA